MRSLLAVLLLSSSALAFEFQSQSGFYGSFAPGNPAFYGIGAVYEPRLALTEELRVGARVDGGAMFSFSGGSSSNTNAGIRIPVALMLKAEYALDMGVRPVFGLAVGTYVLVGLGGGTSGASTSVDTGAFGIMPQLGVDLGGFRIAGVYHLILGQPAGQKGWNWMALELSFRS